MPALESISTLTQEIVGSYDDRAEDLRRLRTTVGSMRQELGSAHQAMSRGLHDSLAQDQAAREAAVGGMLKGYHGTHRAMSRGLHTELARGQARRRSQVGARLVELASDHQAMAVAQQASLGAGAAARQHMAKGLRSHLSQDSAHRKASTKTMLMACQQFRRTISQVLHADLARSKAACSSTVGAMRKGLRNEQAAVQSEWRNMAASMRARRSGQTPKPMATAAPTPAPPPVGGEMAPEPPEFAALRRRVFEYLANRPNGTRLVEMEGEMGVSRFQMSRVLRSLMDKGKVEKRDLFYYAR